MGGTCSAQASSAPVYVTDVAREPAREIQADQEVGATAAARAGEAASPRLPDDEAASRPPLQPDDDAASPRPPEADDAASPPEASDLSLIHI